jgi:hypothetical protein
MKRGHVLTRDTYTGQAEADIEDMIGRPMYIALVADTYQLKKEDRFPEKRPADASVRLVQEAEAKFRLLTDYREFDHFEPAHYLNAASREAVAKYAGFDEAVDRFETLFKDINGMLA